MLFTSHPHDQKKKKKNAVQNNIYKPSSVQAESPRWVWVEIISWPHGAKVQGCAEV